MRSRAAYHRAARISSYPRHSVLVAPCHIAHHLTGVEVALDIASRTGVILDGTACLHRLVSLDTMALGTWLILVA
jgi:hypothetical protein